MHFFLHVMLATLTGVTLLFLQNKSLSTLECPPTSQPQGTPPKELVPGFLPTKAVAFAFPGPLGGTLATHFARLSDLAVMACHQFLDSPAQLGKPALLQLLQL